MEAHVLAILDKDVIVDFHGKANGIVPLTEFKDMPNLKVGDKVEVYVEQQENLHGELVVSRKKAQLFKAWLALIEAHETQQVLQGLVKRKITGGLVLEIFGIEVFLPGSHINTVQTKDFNQYVNTTLEVIVSKVNVKKQNVVVSRKLLLEKELIKQREKIIKNLQEGQVFSGVIEGIAKFGIFVNLGAIVGFLYKKDIAWCSRIEDVTRLVDDKGNPAFEQGQKIDVAVKGFDIDKGQISLSTKMITWSYLPEDIVVGSRIKCVVKDMTDSYAIVEVIEGVSGFLHVSDMSYSYFCKEPKDVIALEKEIDVQVLDIDRERQDLRLGMKQLLPNPWEGEAIDKYQPGTCHKGKVCNFINKGLFVELEPGVKGFLHNKKLSWKKKLLEPTKLFPEGEECEVYILEVDKANKAMQLTWRKEEDNPWVDPAFQKLFAVDTKHEATVIKVAKGGVIVALPEGLERFISNKNMGKKNTEKAALGYKFDAFVVEFNPQEEKILLASSPREKNDRNEAYSTGKATATLGDIEVLRQLKEDLAAQEKKKKS